jgi:hypothetical protein
MMTTLTSLQSGYPSVLGSDPARKAINWVLKDTAPRIKIVRAELQAGMSRIQLRAPPKLTEILQSGVIHMATGSSSVAICDSVKGRAVV